MISKDRESEDLVKHFEESEAGVAELLELYSRVEALYVAASKAVEEGYSIVTSDATNPS